MTINIKQLIVCINPRREEETNPNDGTEAKLSQLLDTDNPELTIRFVDKPYEGLHERRQL